MDGSGIPEVSKPFLFRIMTEDNKQHPKILKSDKELYWYVYPIYLDAKVPKLGLDLIDAINKAIKDAGNKQSTSENCEELKSYLEYQLANINTFTSKFEPEALSELVKKINDRISTLETGIRCQGVSISPETESRRINTPISDAELNAFQRVEVGYFKHRKPKFNGPSAEAWIRNNIPDICNRSYADFLINDKRRAEKLIKLKISEFQSKKCPSVEAIIDVLLPNDWVFVKITTPKYEQVIVEMYDDNEAI